MRLRGDKGFWVGTNEASSLEKEAVEVLIDNYNSSRNWKDRINLIKSFRQYGWAILSEKYSNITSPSSGSMVFLDGNLSESGVADDIRSQMALLQVYVCNINGNATFNDTVVVTGGCSWQGGTVTINGRLIIDQGTLTLITQSGSSESVIVEGVSGNNMAIDVYGGSKLNMQAYHSGKHVHMYIGEGKGIQVNTGSSQEFVGAL